MSLRSTIPALVLCQLDKYARGPTPFSHWVIPKLLLSNAYPGEEDPDAHKARTREIIDAGIQVVVCLMENEELKRFTPYQDTTLAHAKEANREIEFMSFPIPDRSVREDIQSVLEFCLQLCKRIEERQVILVHCWGGHGRTGTIISIIIGILFNLNSEDALSMNRRLHDQRLETKGFSSPDTDAQKDHVRIILDTMYRQI